MAQSNLLHLMLEKGGVFIAALQEEESLTEFGNRFSVSHRYFCIFSKGGIEPINPKATGLPRRTVVRVRVFGISWYSELCFNSSVPG